MSLPELPIFVSDEASDDLIEISLYGIDTWGEGVAARYAEALYERFRHLSQFPKLGRVKEGLAGDIRVLGHGQHVIYYQIRSDSIMILRVVHVRMDATHYLDL